MITGQSICFPCGQLQCMMSNNRIMIDNRTVNVFSTCNGQLQCLGITSPHMFSPNTCTSECIRVVSRFLSSRFHPKSRRLFPFYFSNITLRTDLLTFGVTGAVFKIASEMCRLPAYFDNPGLYGENMQNLLVNKHSFWLWLSTHKTIATSTSIA